jgi:uncharacterized cupin superfamily protein
MGVIDSRVLNIEDLTLEHFKKGDLFESTSARIGPLLGAKDLGYSYDVVPPGKRSCPFHSHRGEEEMFFIVRGNGTLRFGDESNFQSKYESERGGFRGFRRLILIGWEMT